ncbi:UNVERIFIED_CONTAM: hypothetical protein K2H54_034132 [Gekko kuhli]
MLSSCSHLFKIIALYLPVYRARMHRGGKWKYIGQMPCLSIFATNVHSTCNPYMHRLHARTDTYSQILHRACDYTHRWEHIQRVWLPVGNVARPLFLRNMISVLSVYTDWLETMQIEWTKFKL